MARSNSGISSGDTSVGGPGRQPLARTAKAPIIRGHVFGSGFLPIRKGSAMKLSRLAKQPQNPTERAELAPPATGSQVHYILDFRLGRSRTRAHRTKADRPLRIPIVGANRGKNCVLRHTRRAESAGPSNPAGYLSCAAKVVRSPEPTPRPHGRATCSSRGVGPRRGLLSAGSIDHVVIFSADRPQESGCHSSISDRYRSRTW